MSATGLSWTGIARLGLVQAALGAVVVLATSTMNRVMAVEIGLPAVIPGALVALHYGIQVLRPRMGYGSDVGGRCTPWIIGGMAMLALGGVGAALAIAAMGSSVAGGIFLAVIAFAMIGIGVGASGTSVLVLLSKLVAPERRGGAATIVWTMMIAGIAVTATTAGRFLDPFSSQRLLAVTGVVGGVVMAMTLWAVWRIERPDSERVEAQQPLEQQSFLGALRDVWDEPRARRFAVFVFVSMLAYSAQELILEPFAGAVFHLPPGATTRLTGLQHMGVLAGMLLVGFSGRRFGSMRIWTIAGCLGSALFIVGLAASGLFGEGWPLRTNLVLLGAANGIFAVSAIGSMIGLAHQGRSGRAGTRMGVWGAAQAVAFGLGGLLGSGSSDIARQILGSPVSAYACVFAAEAALFLLAAVQASRVFQAETTRAPGASRASQTTIAAQLQTQG